jgi:hypothetical protein
VVLGAVKDTQDETATTILSWRWSLAAIVIRSPPPKPRANANANANANSAVRFTTASPTARSRSDCDARAAQATPEQTVDTVPQRKLTIVRRSTRRPLTRGTGRDRLDPRKNKNTDRDIHGASSTRNNSQPVG